MIRKLKPDDASVIETILKKVGSFGEEEIKVAMELVNLAVSNPEQTDYNVFVYTQDDNVLGYHCTGKRPLTDAVYDLYWIVTDPDYNNKGIGKLLIEHAEKFVLQNNGRWLLIETSSKVDYESARNFYLRNRYSIVSEIKDFYAPGDKLIIFGKYFNNQQN